MPYRLYLPWISTGLSLPVILRRRLSEFSNIRRLLASLLALTSAILVSGNRIELSRRQRGHASLFATYARTSVCASIEEGSEEDRATFTIIYDTRNVEENMVSLFLFSVEPDLLFRQMFAGFKRKC